MVYESMFRTATPPASFFVTRTAGPLADGETEPSRHWGHQLGDETAAAPRSEAR